MRDSFDINTIQSLFNNVVNMNEQNSVKLNSALSNNTQHSEIMDILSTNVNSIASTNEQNSEKLYDANAKLDSIARTNTINSEKLDIVITKEDLIASTNKQNHNQVIESLKEISFDIQRVLGGLAYLATNNVKKCPTVVWLVPAEYNAGYSFKAFKDFMKKATHKKFYLYFVCQHSFEVVPTSVPIEVARDWLKKVAPVLAAGMILLKAALLSSGLPSLPFPIPGLSPENQIALNEEFVNSLLDDEATRLIEAFKASCKQGAEFQCSETSRLLVLSDAAYDAIVNKATKEKRMAVWSNVMEPVPNHRGATIWIKKEYRGIYLTEY